MASIATLSVVCLLILGGWCDLLTLVTFDKAPNSAVACITHFDDDAQIISIDKTYSDNRPLERKVYVFKGGYYNVAKMDMANNYSCVRYDSILTSYFSLRDILAPLSYGRDFSRTLSIFYSGSWLGEMVTRTGQNLKSDYWSMNIIAYNNASSDLTKYGEACRNSTS